MSKKIIIVTGASSGIGQATAEYLASCGNIVYGLSRSKVGSSTVNHLECDITDKGAVEKALTLINQKEGRIDALINNAGLGVSGAVEYSSAEELQRIIKINLSALIETSKLVIPYLRVSQGYLINISSVAGILAIPFQAYYSLTKAAVLSFTKSLRLEVAPFGIKVLAVLPGDTKTSFTQNRAQPLILEDDLYKQRIKHSLTKMAQDEEKGAAPLIVAKVINKALRRKNPPSTIIVGFNYKFLVFLSRILPHRLVEWIIAQMYAK